MDRYVNIHYFKFSIKVNFVFKTHFSFILCIPILPIILGTILETTIEPNQVKSSLGKFLLAYSVISNTKILFRFTDEHPNESEGGGHFQYIHGIRALSSFFIIFCHTFGLMVVPINMKVSAFSRYPNDLKDTNKYLLSQIVYNGNLIVQTFFTMSGMLLTYNALASKLKIKFVPFVLLRWLRYTPPLIGTICMTIALEALGNGPLFHHDLIWPNVGRCYDSLWKNLLYINNFSNFDDQVICHFMLYFSKLISHFL